MKVPKHILDLELKADVLAALERTKTIRAALHLGHLVSLYPHPTWKDRIIAEPAGMRQVYLRPFTALVLHGWSSVTNNTTLDFVYDTTAQHRYAPALRRFGHDWDHLLSVVSSAIRQS